MATERAKQLFGTDGIRGIPGEYPLDDATLERVGSALGQYLRAQSALSERKSKRPHRPRPTRIRPAHCGADCAGVGVGGS